jgi:hypothetical protein
VNCGVRAPGGLRLLSGTRNRALAGERIESFLAGACADALKGLIDLLIGRPSRHPLTQVRPHMIATHPWRSSATVRMPHSKYPHLAVRLHARFNCRTVHVNLIDGLSRPNRCDQTFTFRLTITYTSSSR